jgi:trk system potassium uptake protein TrkH
MQRVLLLTKGFLGEVKRSSHPRAVISLRRGEGTYSGKALEAANVTFFYLFTILGASIMAVLIFQGDIMAVISICVTAVSNSGMAFGEFANPQGVESIGTVPKVILLLVMLLGRFDIMLPLFFLSPGSYRFNG